MSSNTAVELSPETLGYIRGARPEYRKQLGQYFTPKLLRERLLSKLPKLKQPKVLDPACGTGEFLLSAKGYFAEPELSGWEIDDGLVTIARGIVPGATIEKLDALERDYREQCDVVVGNPPYFEFRPEARVRGKFNEILGGRPNIYALFVYLGIRLLKPGGYLAFVVSPSMLNGAYFAKLRQFIVRETNIEYLEILAGDFFEGALQSVMLFVAKKGPNRGDYVFRKSGLLIFSEHAEHLKAAFQGKANLSELGYRVLTGKVVWNQNKHLLTPDSEAGVPLIWSHNITAKGLMLGNNVKKPQYIRIGRHDTGPAIVVNRVVGRPKGGVLRVALVPPDFKFVAENHVNVIYPPPNATLPEIEDIVEQLRLPDRQEIVKMVTGNTQISKNELEKLFPMDYTALIPLAPFSQFGRRGVVFLRGG